MKNSELANNMGNLLGINIDVNEDMKEITNTIKDMFKKKYIDKITNFIEDGKNQVTNNPTKEISLLEAIKPFIDSNNHSKIDRIIEYMNMMRTVQSLNEKIKTIQSPRDEKLENSLKKENKEVLIKEDGIYEIDETCMREKSQSLAFNNGGGIIFIILILLLLNK